MTIITETASNVRLIERGQAYMGGKGVAEERKTVGNCIYVPSSSNPMLEQLSFQLMPTPTIKLSGLKTKKSLTPDYLIIPYIPEKWKREFDKFCEICLKNQNLPLR